MPRSRNASQDADPDAVHRVRTGSRRLQAMLEAMLREAGPAADALERPARAWLRELKQVRRAAGAVRDLDVQRKLLENWVGKQMPEQDAAPAQRGEPARCREISRQKCSMHGSKASANIWRTACRSRSGSGSRGWRKWQGALFTAIDPCTSGQSRSGSAFGRCRGTGGLCARGRRHAVAACGESARLSQGNQEGTLCGRSGCRGTGTAVWPRRLKRVQDAIGEWHDWVCLGEEAEAALGQDAPELTAAFRGEIERHFAAALKTTQSMRGRLLGEWMAAKSPGKRPPGTSGARRPAASLPTNDRLKDNVRRSGVSCIADSIIPCAR